MSVSFIAGFGFGVALTATVAMVIAVLYMER